MKSKKMTNPETRLAFEQFLHKKFKHNHEILIDTFSQDIPGFSTNTIRFCTNQNKQRVHHEAYYWWEKQVL